MLGEAARQPPSGATEQLEAFQSALDMCGPLLSVRGGPQHPGPGNTHEAMAQSILCCQGPAIPVGGQQIPTSEFHLPSYPPKQTAAP